MSAPTSLFDRALERFPTLRQSRLATFDRCALSSSFEIRYEDGWSTIPQGRGTIFHRFAAKALTAMAEMEEGTLPTDQAVAILDECLRQHDIDQRCPDCPAPIVERFQPERDDGPGFPRIRCANGHEHSSSFVNIPFEEIKDLRWVVIKWATDNAFDIDKLVDVEQRLKATLRYPDGQGGHIERVLTGQLDALFLAGLEDEQMIVLDWKDSWGIPAPTELGFDGYFQQRFYPSIMSVTLREFYVRHSEPREATVMRGDIDDVEAELAALVERFDRAWSEGVFPPTPGHHCQFCPRPAACPIFPGVRHEGMITDDETALRVAREMTVAESALSARREALKAYTSVKGPVEVSSHKGRRGWLHKPSKRVSRPSREDMEKALAASRSGVPLRLDDLYREAKVARFGLHAIKDIPDAPEDAQLMSALEASIQQHKKGETDAS
jgi:hypothetical protein